MIEIYGQGKNWAPNKLVVTNSGSNTGEYNFLDRGGGGFLYVDTSQKQVPGRVTYSIVPILSNFTRGLERKLGSIIIPGDG